MSYPIVRIQILGAARFLPESADSRNDPPTSILLASLAPRGGAHLPICDVCRGKSWLGWPLGLLSKPWHPAAPTPKATVLLVWILGGSGLAALACYARAVVHIFEEPAHDLAGPRDRHVGHELDCARQFVGR